MRDKDRIRDLRNMADKHEIIGFTADGIVIQNPIHGDEQAHNDFANDTNSTRSDEEYFHSEDIMSPSPKKPEVVASPQDSTYDCNADEDGHSTGELDDVVMDAEKLRLELDEARKYISRLRKEKQQLQIENNNLKKRLAQSEHQLNELNQRS